MDVSVEKYLRNATIHAESTLLGNYKNGNASATEIERMNKFIVKLGDKEIAYKFIDEIINSNSPNAIMWIVPVCKNKHYKIEVVKNKLLNYSNDKALGILSLNATILLKTLQ